MNTTTIFPPGSKLRRRPQVIEHNAPKPPPILSGLGVAPQQPNDKRPWAFEDHGLAIIPGLLDWPGFEELWATVDGIRQSSMFYVGDALNAGEAKFGDRIYQLDLGGYQPETIRNAQWVSRVFPLSRRRRLPYSYHRACASSKLTAEEQDELLDRAELARARHERFTTSDLAAMVAARIAEKRPNLPLDDPEPEPEPAAGFEPEPQAEPADDDAPQQRQQQSWQQPWPRPQVPLLSPQIEAARACLDEVRAAAVEIAADQHDPIELRALSNRVVTAVGRRLIGWSSNVLQNSDAAEALIPDGWRLAIAGPERQEGRRRWEVKATHADGGRFNLADGPVLACCLAEIALESVISDSSLP